MAPRKWIKLKIAAARGAQRKPWHGTSGTLLAIGTILIGYPQFNDSWPTTSKL